MACWTLRERTINKLESASRHVFSKSNSSYGSDGVTIATFRQNWKNNKADLKAQLQEDCYRFSPIRPVAISKNRSKARSLANARPLSIPTVGDRIVQRAMLEAVWTSIRDRVCTRASYGGVRGYKVSRGQVGGGGEPRKNVRQAIKRITELQDENKRHVFETDIKSFFQCVDRTRLLEGLFKYLKDDTLNSLFDSAVNSAIDDSISLGAYAVFWDSMSGIPQGGVLSPLLANFYLYDFDQELMRRGFDMVRYVDDLVVLGKDQSTVLAAYEIAGEELEKLGLGIHPLDVRDAKDRIKTRIRRPSQTFDFLGTEISARTVLPSRAKWQELMERVDFITQPGGREEPTLIEVISKTNQVLKGWLAAFDFCNMDAANLEQRVDQKVRGKLAVLLERYELRRNRTPLSTEAAKRLGYRAAAEQLRPNPIRKKAK